MSEIPSDIRAAAEAVVERGYDEGLIDAVCRALMAERERAATCCHAALDPDTFVMTGPAGIARQIESAIRRGSS